MASAIVAAPQEALGLSDEQRAAARRFADKILADPARFEQWYEQNYGNVIDIDAIRLYSDDYASGAEARRLMTPATKDVAGRAAGWLLDRWVARAPRTGVARINAGGMSSGKSTSTTLEMADCFDFILDTTLSNYDLARLQLEKILQSGRQVVIRYVHAPFEQAMRTMVKRAAGEAGRYVMLSAMARAHHHAARNALRLSEEFGPEAITLQVVDNTDFGGVPRSAGWLRENLNSDIDSLRRRGQTILNYEWNQNRSNPVYSDVLKAAIEETDSGTA